MVERSIKVDIPCISQNYALVDKTSKTATNPKTDLLVLSIKESPYLSALQHMHLGEILQQNGDKTIFLFLFFLFFYLKDADNEKL